MGDIPHTRVDLWRPPQGPHVAGGGHAGFGDPFLRLREPTVFQDEPIRTSTSPDTSKPCMFRPLTTPLLRTPALEDGKDGQKFARNLQDGIYGRQDIILGR